MGVMLNEVKAHVLSEVPDLAKKGMSSSTIHQLLAAPRCNTRNTKHYHALIDAKVPCEDNYVHKSHQNGQYALAQMNYVRECCAEFANEYICLSSEDMNTIHVGTLAVSHYHHIRSFFHVEDCLLYSDHGFPLRNSKIIPSGYMVLKKPTTRHHTERRLCCLRSRNFTRITHRVSLHSEENQRSRSFSPPKSHNTSDNFKIDKLHRLHRRVPHTGPVQVFTWSAKFHQAASVCHANDIAFSLQKHFRYRNP